jgi:hypothetical protein
MCEPISMLALAGTGLAIGGQVAGFAGEQQSAAAQGKYQNQLYGDTARIAINNYTQGISAIQLRQQQETAAAGDQSMQNSVNGLQAQSRAAVSAGEAGVEGNSVHSLLNDFARQEAFNNMNLHTNLVNQQQQGYQDMLAQQAQAQSQISGATPRPVQTPSPLALGLNIAGTAFSGLDNFMYRSHSGPYAGTGSGRGSS